MVFNVSSLTFLPPSYNFPLSPSLPNPLLRLRLLASLKLKSNFRFTGPLRISISPAWLRGYQMRSYRDFLIFVGMDYSSSSLLNHLNMLPEHILGWYNVLIRLRHLFQQRISMGLSFFRLEVISSSFYFRISISSRKLFLFLERYILINKLYS